tara:strand:- start:960 stop:1121 length:162 start_codon:yes stop_codon:yes gene_type:complete
MTYETITPIAQVLGMVIFILLFAGAVAYALWPSNKDRFKRAAESLLEDERLED